MLTYTALAGYASIKEEWNQK